MYDLIIGGQTVASYKTLPRARFALALASSVERDNTTAGPHIVFNDEAIAIENGKQLPGETNTEGHISSHF